MIPMLPNVGGQDRLRVMDAAGEHLMWVDERAAQDLLKRGQVRLIRRGGRARMLQVRADAPVTPQLALDGHGSGFHAARYVHQRETEDNPPRVWCLIHSTQIALGSA